VRRARVFSFACSALLVLSVVAFAVAPASAARKPGLQLTGAAVVPGPGDPLASGAFRLSSGRGELCFNVSLLNQSGLVNRIVIRRGTAGQSGPEVIRLSPSPIGINGLTGCVPISRELQREIGRSPSDFYLEVETTAYPNGAVRGQLRQ
jgi:hypothetical protein